ncbi:MAG: hypothetical protein HY710_13690 [Candidatus Latescibacteria bacterium]|nr:hypothetical protein [Candidatus Latescibacterota bacterium]
MKPRSDAEKHALIAKAREKAYILYEGVTIPHRSCGICLAETFNLPTRPYQALRRGGITGEGQCGAIKAGELILGEYFGDPDPTGAVTDTLRQAIQYYTEQWKHRVDRGASPDIICNHMTGQFAEFKSPERMTFCTNVAAQVAEVVAETLIEFGADFEITPIPGV